jgi:hypothetical protein
VLRGHVHAASAHRGLLHRLGFWCGWPAASSVGWCLA